MDRKPIKQKQELFVSDTMAGLWRCILVVVMLMCVYLWDSAEAVGGAKSRPRPQRRPPKKPKITPIDLTQPKQDIDIERVRNKIKKRNIFTTAALGPGCSIQFSLYSAK